MVAIKENWNSRWLNSRLKQEANTKATKRSEKLKAYTALVKEPRSVLSVRVRQGLWRPPALTSHHCIQHAQKQKQWNKKVNRVESQTASKRGSRGESQNTICVFNWTVFQIQNTTEKDWIAPVAGRQALLNFLRGLECGSSVEHLPVCIRSWGPTQEMWKIRIKQPLTQNFRTQNWKACSQII